MVSVENLPLRTQKPKFFYGYAVVVAAFFIMTVTYGAMYTFSVFFKPLVDYFGWTRAMTSGAFSLFMIFHGFLYIVTGRLNDRFGPRLLITVCGFFLGLGYILMSQISEIWHLYLYYGIIISIGVSGAFVPLVSTVARWFVLRRSLITGIVAAGVGVGTLVMSPVANWLIYSYGWSNSYIIFGGVVLVFIVVSAQFMRRDPHQMGLLPYGESNATSEIEAQASQDRDFSLSAAIRTRQFWLLCIIWLGFLYSLQATLVHIVIFATGAGFSPASAAGVMAIIGGTSIVGRIVVGFAADRIGNRPAMIICLSVLSLTLFWLATVSEAWAIYLFAVIFGLAYGGLVPLNSPMVAELFGLRSHGVILGIITTSATMGGAAGPVVAGYIFDIRESYQLAFVISGIVAAVVAILASFLRPMAGQDWGR